MISRRLLMGIPEGSENHTAQMPQAEARNTDTCHEEPSLFLMYLPSHCPSAPSSVPQSHLSQCPGHGLEEQHRAGAQHKL